jgi:hypothetical protein
VAEEAVRWWGEQMVTFSKNFKMLEPSWVQAAREFIKKTKEE